MQTRSSGILLHITSLATRYGIGDLGPSARQFVDFLIKSQQKYWQILPINPTDGINGHSPYSCYSAFAGNPLLISPEQLVLDGFLSRSDISKHPRFNSAIVDYPAVMAWKKKILALAFKRFKNQASQNEDFQSFCHKQEYWLKDYSDFIVIKAQRDGASWDNWPRPLKFRDPKTLRSLFKKNREAILAVQFEQYLFFKQWFQLKDYCVAKGIKIIGDIPIYVNFDSVSVWKNPGLFKLDRHLKPKFVSGVPPDYFSKTGQRWGNPVYNWRNLRASGYLWWIKRLEHNLKLFDFLRIDHFRGFVGFWQIPADQKIAVFGKWEKAPGVHFFGAVLKSLGKIPILAEDLGYITQDVIDLVKRFKFPGMRVLLFAFDDFSRNNPHHPENYPKHCVAYTGTHDNNTILGWYQKDASAQARANVMHFLKNKFTVKNIHWGLIKAVMSSAANTVVVPIQDILGLGDEARINRPSTTQGNWQWRMKAGQLNERIIRQLARLTRASRRI